MMTLLTEPTTPLALVLALMGLLPSGMALASAPRGPAVEMAGTVREVRREHVTLQAADGRLVRVDAEACASSVQPGQALTFEGHWDSRGTEFDATALRRPGAEPLACREPRQDHGERHRLAAAAPVDAQAAIQAAQRAGYAQVISVEWEHGAWRLRATDSQGRPARLSVDGWSGQVSTRGW